ncbi:MAG: DegT/DnrJ/EryC1/StrS family aminotransferase [Myxococcales bacterium]|nr:MAG: DegT/DnrJ/EryC1/StrS family aminotransferase [Myxococcales bacterium]
MAHIPLAGPWITEKEAAYAAEAAREGWYAKANHYQARFEEALAAAVGRRFALVTPSCTTAIHLALAGLGIGPEDQVIVPETTWIASAAPISYCGATPVFADVDPHSLCLDAASAAKAVGAWTKAIVAVDLYGSLPDMEALALLAANHGVALIEDAAEALGSSLNGKRAGAFGLCSVFSFHGSKTLSTGEGGALATDDEVFFRRCLFLRDHGRNPGDTSYLNVEVAYKYKMAPVVAALGLAQLERLDDLVAKKREIFGWYRETLAVAPEIRLNEERPGLLNSYWLATALLPSEWGVDRNALLARLTADDIGVRPVFYPLSSLPAYRRLSGVADYRKKNPVAYRLAKTGLNLPSALTLTKPQIEFVIERLLRHVADLRQDRQ